MYLKRSRIILIIAFSALFLTSGKYTDQASIHRLWGTLNNQFSFDLSKQSFCLEIDGKVIGQNTTKKMRPASVTKLYTSYWAIKELGHDYRFQTEFFISNDTLYIIGGNDSYFVTENLILILDKLNTENVFSINKIVFDQNFYLNWTKKSSDIKSSLYKIFNTKRWSKNELNAYRSLNDYLSNTTQTQILKPEFHVNSVEITSSINYLNDTLTITHLSSPLSEQLKPINMYSNNFYTDNLFDLIGGSKAFEDFMYRVFNATADQIKFYTGSGLGENYTTCELTLELLTELKRELERLDLNPFDIMSVAGTDEGTLKKRFTKNDYNDLIMAKTGTLRHTSALAGYIKSNEQTKFVVFNHSYNIQGAREIQNMFVKSLIDNNITPFKIEYEKLDYPSIKNIILK